MESQSNKSNSVNLETVLARLREQVAQRRQAGAYPPGLEEELEAELLRIVTRPSVASPFTDMREVLEDRGRPPGVDPARVARATGSSIPGGAALHTAVARAVGHQTAGVLAQVQDISNALWDDLLILADAVTALKGRLDDKGALLVIVDALVERVAAYERAPVDSSLGVAELIRRVERLEAAEAARHARPWFDTELVPEAGGAGALVELAEGLEACGPVLVLGPEHLRVELRERGIEVSEPSPGADRDPVCALASSIDRSLGALVVADTLERLAPGQVLELVRASADKLRRGGRLVARAANPRSLWGLAHGSAGRPDRCLVDPGWLELCAREAGYSRVELAWGPPAPGGAPPAGEGTEAGADRALLFGPLYYTMRATR